MGGSGISRITRAAVSVLCALAMAVSLVPVAFAQGEAVSTAQEGVQDSGAQATQIAGTQTAADDVDSEALATLAATGLEVKQLATGRTYCMAILSDGSLWTWGDNRYSQLGRETDGSDDPTPTQVVFGTAAGFYTDADGNTVFYKNGEQVKGEFVKVDKTTGKAAADDAAAGTYDVYYFRKSGTMITGLAKIYGAFRCFDKNGVRQYGFQDVLWENVVNDDGTHSDGKAHRMFFYNAGERPSGTLQAGIYIKIDKETKKILTQAEGDALSDGSTYDVYYPRKNGEILTGLGQVYGRWRYFGDDGIRRYGLQNVEWSADKVVNDKAGSYTDGQVHTMYFGAEGPKPSGVLVTSTTVEVDGKSYTFDEIGGLTSVDGVPTTVVDL